MGRPRNSGKSVVAVPAQFDRAETAEVMAKPIIASFHPHLINCKIAYVYYNKPMKQGNRVIFATAKKCSPLTRDLCKMSGGEGFDFIITINYEAWNTLTDTQKKAIIDHELCHCVVEENEKTGKEKLSIAPHDLAEFSTILDHWGPEIFEDLRRFCALAKSKMEKKGTREVEVEDLLED